MVIPLRSSLHQHAMEHLKNEEDTESALTIFHKQKEAWNDIVDVKYRH